MARCSCGGELIPDPSRQQRMGGDLLEYRECSAGCLSTTSVVVEACGHAVHRGYRVGEDSIRCRCLECGHQWDEHGAEPRS